MNYEAFRRVPNTCGVWRKLRSIDSDKWLRKLLNGYLDETTKQRQEGWGEGALMATATERRALIEEGKAPMLPGEDFTPFASGIWVFGHVASKLNEAGDSATFAQSNEVISRLAEWWVNDRSGSVIKGHHVVASFDDRIALELHRRGYPVDAMLLASVHQTLSQYAARFYPGQTLGWVAGCHHDRAHAHVHAVIHPTTSDGKLLRVSGLKDDEPGEDKFEFLRKSFNTRSRQLFVGLTQQEGPKEEDLALAARQLMLMSHHALIKSRPQEPGALTRATEMLNGWAAAKDYSAVVSEASNAVEEEFRMAEPTTPNPAGVRAGWGKICAEWDRSRAAHLDAAMGAFKAVTAHRTAPDSYAPERTTFARPMVPMEPEYEALASVSAGVPVTSRTEALAARRAASDRIREDVNVALEAYRASLERCRPNLDTIRVRAAYNASQISLGASLSLGVPLSFKEVGLNTGKPVPRMILAGARMEAYAERELCAIASVEAAAHQPEDPGATPGLLASSQYPHFRELGIPAKSVPVVGGMSGPAAFGPHT